MESHMAQGLMDQDLDLAIQTIRAIQAVPDPIESTVRVVERKSLSKFPRQKIRSCCAWIALENREIRVRHSSQGKWRLNDEEG